MRVKSSGIRWMILVFTVVSMGSLMASCSGASKDKMLRFFFDEPPLPAKEKASRAAQKAKVDSVQARRKFASPPVYVVHSPYSEKECGACHALAATKSFTAEAAAAAGGSERSHEKRLILPPEELCFECHDDKSMESLEEEAELVHGPVAAGECLFCHHPHRSRYKALLRKSDPLEKLCFECHDSEDVISTGTHADLEGEACTECHDPHAAGEFLLK